jgi:hypothetical protein
MGMYGTLYLSEEAFKLFGQQASFGEFWRGEPRIPHEGAEDRQVWGRLVIQTRSDGDDRTARYWRSLTGFLPKVRVNIRLDKEMAHSESGELLDLMIRLCQGNKWDFAVVLDDHNLVLRRLDGRVLVARPAYEEWTELSWSRLGAFEMADVIETWEDDD